MARRILEPHRLPVWLRHIVVLAFLLVLAPPGVQAQSLDQLVAQLQSGDIVTQYNAMDRIGALGPVAAPLVPELTPFLRHAHPALRANALWALSMIGEAAEPAAPAMAELLADVEPTVQLMAVLALTQIGATAWQHASMEHAGPLLAALLGSGDRDLSLLAMEAIAYIGPGAADLAPMLIPSLSDPQPSVNGPAYKALIAVGRPAVPVLIGHVQDARKSDESRTLGIRALGEIGPDAVEAVPTLIGLLHISESLYIHAFVALERIGEPAVPYLVEAMSHPERSIAWTTALLLRALGEPAVERGGASIVPELMSALDYPDAEVREAAVWALGVVGDDSIIPVQVRMLGDEARIVREEAQRALVQRGAVAVPYLAEAFRNLDLTSEVRSRSVESLMFIGEPALDALIDALDKDPDPWVRWRAAWAISSITGTAAPESDTLASMLDAKRNEADVRVQVWSRRALELLDAESRDDPFLGWDDTESIYRMLVERIGEVDVSAYLDEIAPAEELEVFLLGVVALQNRQLEVAGWLFWQDAHRRPYDAMPISHLGLVLHEMYVAGGEADSALLEGAILALRRAAELAPQEPSVLNNLAYALSRRGLPDDLAEASWLIERAVELDPEEALYWVRRALIAQDQGDETKALESIFVAHAMNPVVAVAMDPTRIAGFVEADKSYCEIVCLACDSCPPGLIGELNRIACLIEESNARAACQAGEIFPTSFNCQEALPEFGILIPGLNSGLSILTPFGELHVTIDGHGMVSWKAGVKIPAGRLEIGAGAVGTWDPSDGVMVSQFGPYYKVTGLGRSDFVKSKVIDTFEAWGPNANPFVVKLASEYEAELGRTVEKLSIESASITVWTSH